MTGRVPDDGGLDQRVGEAGHGRVMPADRGATEDAVAGDRLMAILPRCPDSLPDR